RGLHCEARQRALADVEILVAEGPEKDFFRVEPHEHRIDTVDLHRAVDQRPVAVVVADRDGQIELGHGPPRQFGGEYAGRSRGRPRGGGWATSISRSCVRSLPFQRSPDSVPAAWNEAPRPAVSARPSGWPTARKAMALRKAPSPPRNRARTWPWEVSST